jgi:hypothetical protein
MWEYNIEMDLEETGCEDWRWMELAHHWMLVLPLLGYLIIIIITIIIIIM